MHMLTTYKYPLAYTHLLYSLTHLLTYSLTHLLTYGLQGTCRPTHYHVLICPTGLTADEMQQFTFDLCHMYAPKTLPRALTLTWP
jgi:hypothetical protein